MKRIVHLLLTGSLMMQGQGTAAAQDVQASVSNFLRYGTGERGITAASTRFKYFENLTDVRLVVQPSVTIGFRLLVDDPPEVGSPFQGLKRRFIEFQKDNLSIRAGNFSALFGRGLALNLFENRGLAYDSWLDGLKATYKSAAVSVSLVGGTLDFRDSIIVTRFENYKVRGGNVELRPVSGLSVGVAFLSVDGAIPRDAGTRTIKAEVPELYAAFHAGSFDGFVGWSQKKTTVNEENTISTGSGLYSSLSYTGEGFGIAVEYKNYRFDVRDPLSQSDLTRPTRMLPIQNPPIVQKEHSYTLLTRAIHQVDFNDEVGIQAEGFFSLSDATTLTVNASMASRHTAFRLQPSTFGFSPDERSASFLPGTSDDLSPFREIFTEAEHYFDEHTALRIGLGHRSKVVYNDFSGPEFSHTIRSTVIPVQYQFFVADGISATVQSEHEFVHDNYNTSQEKFYNHLFTLILAKSPNVSAALRHEITTNKFDPSGRMNWIVGEIGYHIGQTHSLTVAYGRGRGGQACSNGVCGYIQPFVGVRLSLQTRI